MPLMNEKCLGVIPRHLLYMPTERYFLRHLESV